MATQDTAITAPHSMAVAEYRRSTDAASICKEIVVATSKYIGGKRHVRAEGWQAIATAHGCVASARDVERLDGGIRAIGEVRRIDTGAVIATAEGFVGNDEELWAKRPEYARRAMAQTRAISRACRTAFAHVVVMMSANLDTTPAEEVPPTGFGEARKDAAPPQKQQPSDPGEKTLILELPIDKVKVSNGARNGKPWTRWSALIGGEWYSTFDESLGEALQVAHDNPGTAFRVTVDRSGKYLTVTAVEDISADAGAKSEEAIADPREKDDDMPF